MKKILIATNVLMFSLLLLAYKEKGDANTDSGNNAPPVNYKLGIPPQLAKQMLSNYKGSIWNQRKIKNQNFLDARSVWFSIGKIKAFIADIEAKAAAKGCMASSDELGIRIYYCVYPEADANWKSNFKGYFGDHKLPATYGELHTVLMVPTIWNPSDSFHYDFDPRYISSNEKGICTPIPVAAVMDQLMALNAGEATKPADVNGIQRLISQPDTQSVSTPSSDLYDSRMAYIIMPDNLDNKRFYISDDTKRIDKNTSSILKVNQSSSVASTLSTLNSVTSDPTDVDFTNGGNLIPPPYYPPAPQGIKIAKTTASEESFPVASSKLNKFSTTFYVPYSGAAFMRWADGTINMGWNTIPVYPAEIKVGKKTGLK